ncbi:MAG: enoyl-CoA hydratase-related protein, partial [Fimbriimonadales bacterium]
MSDHLTSFADGVLTVTLNRPDVRNALDDKLIAGLTETFRSMGDDDLAVVLKGEGKSFCAGGDLAWMQRSINYTEAENLADAQALGGLFLAIDDCPCPVIGQVHGAAFGGGVGLACVCDVVVAAEGTKFCFSEVKLGLSPAVISAFA